LPSQEEQNGRFLHRPQQDYPAATVAEFCTAVLIWRGFRMVRGRLFIRGELLIGF
jgi:hypothetical protein